MTEFWHTMVYGCDSGDPEHEIVFYLEVGCEGPRDSHIDGVRMAGPLKGQPIRIPLSNSGRPIVPVPFVAGWCAQCRTVGGCGHQLRGRFKTGVCGQDRQLCSITHVRWSDDRNLDPTVDEHALPDGAGAFLYPTITDQRRDAEAVCGRPVYPMGMPA